MDVDGVNALYSELDSQASWEWHQDEFINATGVIADCLINCELIQKPIDNSVYDIYTSDMEQKNNERMLAIHDKFARLVKLYQEVETKPRAFGTDELLTGSDIHLIEMIGDNEERLSVTDLAMYSHVTKGAISQNLKKLEKKNLTFKEEDPQNSSRSMVKLTSKGKAAYYSHRHWHETMDGGYLSYLTHLEEEKAAFLMEFMERVETFLRSVIAEGG